FHPDDGRRLGLEGMIEAIVRGCDYDLIGAAKATRPSGGRPGSHGTARGDGGESHTLIPHRNLGLFVSAIEENTPIDEWRERLAGFRRPADKAAPLVLGVTG